MEHCELETAEYILRYYLPMEPYADAALTQLRFDQLLDFCRETGTRAVMFYVAFRTDWYYMPDTPEHAERWAAAMAPFVRRLREEGISYQLNFQNLLGSITGGADFSNVYGWETMTDHRGRVNTGCGCFLGKTFREKMGRQLRIWAATEPDVIWIDDDFRLHNHDALLLAGYRDWFCYCGEHLRQFNERFGTSYDRTSLLRDMLRPGQPHPVRAQWLRFQGEVIAQAAAWVSEQVHSVSPRTRLAQMTSLPGVHAAEGRDWGSFLNALSGEGYRAILRPHFGPYAEGSPLEFLRSMLCVEQTRAHVQQQYGDAEYCPEIENTRFTAWSKSVAATRFQLYLSELLGCPGITLSLFDLEGSALSEEPDYIELLREEKPALDGLARLRLRAWQAQGAALVTSPDTAARLELQKQADSPDALAAENRTFDEMLVQCGIPVRYVSPREACEEDGLVALDGDTVCAFSDEELEQLMHRRVLLDGEAVRRLIGRGFAADIGIRDAQPGECMTSAELFEAPDGGKRMPCRLSPGRWMHFTCAENARAHSTMVLCSGERAPGMTEYRNAKGGRIFAYPAFGAVERGFYNHVRARALRALVRSAAPSVPLFWADRSALTLCRTEGSTLLLAAAPLSADGAGQFTAALPEGAVCTRAEVYRDGEFRAADTSELCVRDGELCIRESRGLYQWMIVRLELARR